MAGTAGEEGAALSLKAWIGFLSLAGGTFMAVLDTQIVASSLPVIAANLGATLEEASWIQMAYMIAEVIMIPLAGWLSRALSLRYLYAGACSLFTFSSIVCATASTLDWLVTARILQGLGSGLMAPLLYQGIYILFPPHRRSGATLFVVFIVSLAPLTGPALGGWITDTWSWRWLFLINILPGAVVTAAVLGLVRSPAPQLDILKRWDFYGIMLAALFLGPLEYVLGEGPDREWFDSPLILILTVVAITSGLLFIRRELSCRNPVVELRAFLDRNFSTGCFLNFGVGFGLFGSGYLMAFFLSGVKRYGSLQIGDVMAVPGAAMMLSIPLVRMVRRRVGGRGRLALGLSMFASAVILNSVMTAETAYDQLLLPQILRGMGIMFSLSPITELALGRLPREAVANATGLYSLMRSLGGGIGIAVVGTVVEMRERSHFHRLAERFVAARGPVADFLEGIDAFPAAHLPDVGHSAAVGLKRAAMLAGREASVLAVNDCWLMMGALFALLLMLMPFVQKVDG